MRIPLLLACCSCLALYSCQKELDYATRNNSGGGGNDPLLTKIVSISGTDTSTLSFGYNSSRLLMTLDATSVSAGTSTLTQERVERNSQGIIQDLVIKDAQYKQFGLDSVITRVDYASGRYAAKVTVIDLGVAVYRDSVSLYYDANGKVVTEKTYADLGTGYSEFGKIEYSYNGANISAINSYAYDSTTASYTAQQSYTYDAFDGKVSPLNIGNEAFVFDSPTMYSSSNPTHSTVEASGSTQIFTTNYTYNALNKPVTATSLVQPGNSTTSGTYYYQ